VKTQAATPTLVTFAIKFIKIGLGYGDINKNAPQIVLSKRRTN
jgi:hypothetical protein